ncbi:hypothetical protein CLOM_g18111 [Closterium sp. NIES-68]|nr:hypothetical protein CLOM_g18111 [Closterium sp. NIES-68]GJP72583.1 hypothetical protein CLOP_g3296 [Closterium sp. NIES-67]
MWAAVIAAVAASSGNNIGKVLQKQATRSLPRLTLESKVVWTYLLSPLWVTGLIIDVGGGLLMLQAVASAPVSIVQPVSTSGLALMALFSHVYLHEPMRLADWTGILLCILGTVAVGVSSENPLPSAPPPQLSLRHLMAFVFWVVLLMCSSGVPHPARPNGKSRTLLSPLASWERMWWRSSQQAHKPALSLACQPQR